MSNPHHSFQGNFNQQSPMHNQMLGNMMGTGQQGMVNPQAYGMGGGMPSGVPGSMGMQSQNQMGSGMGSGMQGNIAGMMANAMTNVLSGGMNMPGQSMQPQMSPQMSPQMAAQLQQQAKASPGMMHQGPQQQASMSVPHVGGPGSSQVVGPAGVVPVGVPGQGPIVNAPTMNLPGPGPIGQVGPSGVGGVGGVGGVMPGRQQPTGPPAPGQLGGGLSMLQSNFNTAAICRFGLELVQDIMSRATEVFLILKGLQPPNGTQMGTNVTNEKKAKIQDLLTSINALFKRLATCYAKCSDNCQQQGMEYMHTESLIPLKEEYEMKSDEKTTSEAYRNACNEKRELVEQVVLKNKHLKDIIDSMRQTIWEINSMLHMRRS